MEKHITFIRDNILSEFEPSEWGSLRSGVDNHKLFEIYAKYQIKYRNEIAEFREFQRFIASGKIKYDILEKYKNNQIDRICSLVGKDVFLSDYYGVLHNIYLCLTDARKFYDDYKVGDLDKELVDNILNNKAEYDFRNFDEFQIMINRSRGAYSRHVPMIDEGQDFHPLERDILFEIFHKKNMVVATGGKEQLIRHQLECDWTVDNQGKKHNTIIINKRNKSYRLKKGIADLCNKLAKAFEIKLDLETDNQELGHVIISSNIQDIQNAFDIFHKNGEVNYLNPCESIYLIIEAESEIFKHHYDESEVTSITENGVAIQNKVKFKSEPDLSSCLDTKGLDFYYANMGNNYFNKKSISNSEYLVSFMNLVAV
ncbi:hypothetical protein [Neisseria weixii]|uniref:hypothetical protein n=1 Tax=Neisseria weixii TaxID=1853276 RepID=UPI000BB7C28F|nr:hypothetical protein [Neisseria weixii]ATD64285.1 hypothetical protein CGZ65_01190 [Neisseria weixii]